MTQNKNSKAFVLFKSLIAIALLAASFAIFTLKQAGDKKDNMAYSKPKDLVFKDLARRFPDVRRVKVTTPEGSFQFRNNNGVWQIVERNNYPLNTTKLTEFANQLASLSVMAVKSNDPGEFDELGVGEPLEFGFGSIIEFFDSQDQTIDASHIGQKRGEIYVRRMGENKIRLADGKLMDFTKINDWPDFRLYAISRQQIKGIGFGPNSAQTDKYVPDSEGVFQNPQAQLFVNLLLVPDLHDVSTNTRINSKPIKTINFLIIDGSIIKVTFYYQNGSYWVKYKATGANDIETEFSKALNQKADSWAFAINKTQAESIINAAY